jgi:tetratricopeptide (TPR) repeat protein
MLMRTTSPKLDNAHLDKNEEAELRCRSAFNLKDRGEYKAACDAMFPLWNGIGSRPDTRGLREDLVPRLLLCAGVLTGWLGGKDENRNADDYARDLITESITLFEALDDSRKVAEARAELGHCYWRAGANDEARIMFSTALDRLTTGGPARANALLGLSSVEWAESRYNEVLRILTLNAPLFERITNHTIKGTYHNQLGLTLRAIGSTSKRRTDYFARAIQQYHSADEQFKLAKHHVFRAHVKNNIAYVLRELHRFQEAHECLEQARRLFARVGDKVRTAQVDDSRAQLFIEEKKYSLAEPAARSAARSFERAGRPCFLAEALTDQGIALARMREAARAQFVFRKAIEVAHNAGSLSRAGLAALTMIEEIPSFPRELHLVAFGKAKEWLADTYSPDIRRRLKAAGKKLGPQVKSEESIDMLNVLFNKRCNLRVEVLQYEHELVSGALAQVNGKITEAAELLGIGYQTLAFIIETKHPDLLNKRTPVRRRPRKR